MLKWLGLLCLVAACCWPSASAQIALDAETQARINEGVRLGREIYAHDQAAWHGTDAMLADIAIEGARKSVGFLTERVDAERVRAVFVQIVNDELRELYSAVIRGSMVENSQNFIGSADAPLLSPGLRRKHEAQAKVRQQIGQQICGRNPNIVVLDSASAPGALDVYVIVPEMSANEAVMYGHTRFTVAQDGGEPVEHAYYMSCGIVPDGRGAEALMLTVLPDMGDIPHELHNFSSLNLKTQMFVLTASNGRVWGIADGIPLLLTQLEEDAVQ